MHPRRRLPPITTPKAGATTAQGAIPCTLGAVSPLTSALRKSNRRRGSNTAHTQRNSPRPRPQLAGQPPPICHRGRISARPRQQLPHQAAAQHRPTDTEGAAQYTLGANHPQPRHLRRKQPPPKAQPRAPSTQIAPLTAAPTLPNRHRGSVTVHPRRRLPPITTPQAGATATEGAIPRTLNPNHPAHSDPKHRQPPPKAHQRAPSKAVSPPAAAPDKGNRHPRRNPAHPRRRLPAGSCPSTTQPPPREQHSAPSKAVAQPGVQVIAKNLGRKTAPRPRMRPTRHDHGPPRRRNRGATRHRPRRAPRCPDRPRQGHGATTAKRDATAAGQTRPPATGHGPPIKKHRKQAVAHDDGLFRFQPRNDDRHV
ncbi:hypothetical protein CLV65_1158 [Pseudoscardovia suis]|uniref:Uncharacterized protein n=1 Tax=Pseudoscardovia suis TaxID=987063 RepID=A0A261EUK1_9BIFI|nr:hypothetical protein PSSU_1217 [Pseudoscardovia suis]PJJ65911.1 hypothetical protein CLV65_1158 [Pseudoscardovia suis]